MLLWLKLLLSMPLFADGNCFAKAPRNLADPSPAKGSAFGSWVATAKPLVPRATPLTAPLPQAYMPPLNFWSQADSAAIAPWFAQKQCAAPHNLRTLAIQPPSLLISTSPIRPSHQKPLAASYHCLIQVIHDWTSPNASPPGAHQDWPPSKPRMIPVVVQNH